MLLRVRGHLGDPGAFGRVVQEIIVTALRSLYPGLHDNRGAGTPDCQYHDGQWAWAWEIKFADGDGVQLGDRDIEGLHVAANDSSAKSRLIVLDIAFPARLWVIDASRLMPGPLILEAHSYRQQAGEAGKLATAIENVIWRVDVGLIASEQEAKALVQSVAESSSLQS
jgi:hypothetical protein